MTVPAAATADTPFAVACPGCHGALAVTLGLANSAACCPLCACGFLVPDPRQPQDAPATTKRREPRPRPPREPAAGDVRPVSRDLDIPSQFTAGVTAASSATPGPTAAPEAGLLADDAAGPADVAAGPLGAAAAAVEYRFREAGPVIIGSGADAIELRRLTPEEKQARRIRRNLIMLLSGSAMLIVITFIFGRSSGRRRRGR